MALSRRCAGVDAWRSGQQMRVDGVRGPTTTGGIFIKMDVTWADAGRRVSSVNVCCRRCEVVVEEEGA